jgi:hypothetical protein
MDERLEGPLHFFLIVGAGMRSLLKSLLVPAVVRDFLLAFGGLRADTSGSVGINSVNSGLRFLPFLKGAMPCRGSGLRKSCLSEFSLPIMRTGLRKIRRQPSKTVVDARIGRWMSPPGPAAVKINPAFRDNPKSRVERNASARH